MLGEYLEVPGYSQAEFTSLCGLSHTLISGILAGTAPIEPETVLRFEKVLGLNAGVWVNIESIYWLQLAKKKHRRRSDNEKVRRLLLNAPHTVLTRDSDTQNIAFAKYGQMDPRNEVYP